MMCNSLIDYVNFGVKIVWWEGYWQFLAADGYTIMIRFNEHNLMKFSSLKREDSYE